MKSAKKKRQNQPHSSFLPVSALKLIALLIVGNFLFYLNVSTISGLYYKWQQAFGIGPKLLGTITSTITFTELVLSPLWGWLASRINPVVVLGCGGTIVFGSSLLIAASGSYTSLLLAGVCYGAGYAAVIVTIMSMLVEYTPEDHWGKAFGTLSASIDFGLILGNIFGSIAAAWLIFEIQGWRFAYIILALLQLGYLLFLFFVYAKGKGIYSKYLSQHPVHNLIRTYHHSDSSIFRYVFKFYSILLLLVNELFKIMVFSTSFYAPLLLKLYGFSANAVVTILLTLGISGVTGNVVGGWLADKAAKLSPKNGRIWVMETSLILGGVLFFLALYVYPTYFLPDFKLSLLMALLGVISIGFCAKWVASGPLVAEVTPTHHRSIIFSGLFLMEMVGITLGVFLIGYFSEAYFGYSLEFANTAGDSSLSLENVRALSYSMLVVCEVPTIICMILLICLQFSHHRHKIIKNSPK